MINNDNDLLTKDALFIMIWLIYGNITLYKNTVAVMPSVMQWLKHVSTTSWQKMTLHYLMLYNVLEIGICNKLGCVKTCKFLQLVNLIWNFCENFF